MKYKPLFLAALTTLATGFTPVLAQSGEPSRPVLEAAIEAGPGKRLEAARFFRSSYPGLLPDIYAQVKADYPDLEHGVVDAWLATREQHPAGRIELMGKVKERYGPRLTRVRTAVLEELEAEYPVFKNRLNGVLEKHGPAQRWRKFLAAYDPELFGQLQNEVKSQVPGWYPGKFREMWRNGESGPVLDKLRAMAAENPQLRTKLASTLVRMARTQAPGLGEDAVRHFLDNRGQLIDALRAEFPGAGDKIVAVIERTDPELPRDVARFVRTEAAPMRADFRKNLEARLPGLEDKVRTTIARRYPDLQQQMLRILKG